MTAKSKNTKASMPLSGLQVVGTPIGNLEDITLRALSVLREADLIAAEDTRRTRKLLSRYDIHTSLVSYHEHNKRQMGPKLIARLQDGEVVALVSDAGMPGISDPGHDLIALAIEENIPVSIVPGPSAITSALILSGLPARSFQFEGFLPRKKGECWRRIKELMESASTSVIFESPNRLTALLALIAQFDPERRVAVAREMTKRFEEIVRGSASEVVAYFVEKQPRGEFVVVVEGARATATTTPLPAPVDAADIVKDIMKNNALSKKDAMRKAAQQLNISRREVYKLMLEKDSAEQQDE